MQSSFYPSSYIIKRRPVTSRGWIKRSRDAVNYYFEQIKACPPRLESPTGVINESTDKRSASVLPANLIGKIRRSPATVPARNVTWVVERENGDELLRLSADIGGFF